MIGKRAKNFIEGMKKPPDWQQQKLDSMKRLEKGFEILIKQNDKMIELLDEIHRDIHEMKDQNKITYNVMNTVPVQPLIQQKPYTTVE